MSQNVVPLRTEQMGPFRLSPDATDIELLAKYFRGFGDPTRLRILALIAERQRSVGELVHELEQPQPKVSNHLACLRWCGFVIAERRGRQVFYRLSDPGVTQVIALTRVLLDGNVEHVARYNLRRAS